jgi:hypothetical protein
MAKQVYAPRKFKRFRDLKGIKDVMSDLKSTHKNIDLTATTQVTPKITKETVINQNQFAVTKKHPNGNPRFFKNTHRNKFCVSLNKRMAK